jgi:hypothetical protein
MRDNLISSGVLNGKSRDDIKALLGIPLGESDSLLRYDMGATSHGLGVKGYSLILHLRNRRVSTVEEGVWYD